MTTKLIKVPLDLVRVMKNTENLRDGMDNIIYFVGNKFCSVLNSFGGSILSNKVGCGWDNYDIGLYVLIFLIFFFFGGGFFFFSSEKD